MMQLLSDDWTILFNETSHSINFSNSPIDIICNDCIIVDDILLFSNHIPTLLHYFSCVAQVFTKFRLSFKLGKCDFLKDRVEYVGHDLTANGNCPAASKFSLLQDWPLPPTVSLYCPLLVYVVFTTGIAPGSRQTSNHFESCNVHTIAKPSLSWDGHLL